MNASPRCRAIPAVLSAAILIAAVLTAPAPAPAQAGAIAATPLAARPSLRDGARPLVIEDFESGAPVLGDYPGQDQQADHWELTTDAWEGGHALRVYGNCWKTQAVAPRALDAGTYWQVAVKVVDSGEMSAFGLSDGVNELFYTFAGSELPEPDKWWTTYQGAFPLQEWRVYLLPVGEDWHATHGDWPAIDTLIYVNDDDAAQDVVTLFDAVWDVTADMPVAPSVAATCVVRGQEKVARDLWRVDVQFHGSVHDPDSEIHDLLWDFGDGSISDLLDPAHTFLVQADYEYAVSFTATDPDGRAGTDTCRVAVEPGPGGPPVTVNFVGDVMTARNYEYSGGIIDTQGVEAIFEPTLPILGDAADVTVCNLECCYTDQGTPHPTKFYTFRSRPENIAGIVYAGIDVANLANNHCMDYGEPGMLQTAAVLDSVGILRMGTGVVDHFALQPAWWTERGVRLALLGQCNFTEREWNHQPFTDAGASKPGHAYLIPKNLEKAIGDVRPHADVVVIQYHSGIEYELDPPPEETAAAPDPAAALAAAPYPATPAAAALAALVEADAPTAGAADLRLRNEPTPGERALRRLGLDLGADMVINHHPHVLQGFESHGGKLIAHSMGNFVMDLSYVQTFPTMVLTLEVGREGILGTRVTPAWIDHYIPRPATGRLGREILDWLADKSRPMGALVATDLATATARVYADPGAAPSRVEQRADDLALRDDGQGFLRTEPLELSGAGSLSRLVSVTGAGASGWEYRLGSEVLWHGGFEDEGADLWDTNSGDEWLDDTESWAGVRSLALRRDHGAGQHVVTDTEKHLMCDGARAHTVVAARKGLNAAGANVLTRFYTSAYAGSPISETPLDGGLDGDAEWFVQWLDLDAPPGGDWFELHCVLYPPASGEARAWFDGLRLVEWEPWQPGADGTSVAAPGNIRYVQLRTEGALGGQLSLVHEATLFGDAATAAPEAPAPAPAALRLASHPNPFNPRATIVLEVPAGAGLAEASVEVFDVRGRRLRTLFRGRLPRGARESFAWDGRDERGRRLASGVYLCRARVDGTSASRKLVLLK